MTLLAKKLMYNMYKDQPFFKAYEQQRTDVLGAFLTSLMIADGLPKEQKLKKAKDMASLDLHDPLLNGLSYYMFKGALAPQSASPPKEKIEKLLIPEGNGEDDDENGDPNKKDEYKSPQGYTSLLDSITLEDSAKIRVFLAPKELLKAIFDDPAAVDGVIQLRNGAL